MTSRRSDQNTPRASPDPVVANSREMIARGSKSFAVAAGLFDSTTRDHAYMLYAWCRYCDDRIDGQDLGFGQRSPEPAEQRRRLEALKIQTEAAMAGAKTDDLVFAAFQRVFQACRIPERYPLELLEGFALDVDKCGFETLDDTLTYCYHVAGTVGAMMATIMGVHDASTLDRAIDLGIALQLTNIARDIMEDAGDGRIYVPAEWLRQANAPTEPTEFPDACVQLAEVTGRLLDEAEKYYASSSFGIAQLPFRCAWAIATARAVYRDIGRIVRKRGANAWTERASTSSVRKITLLFAGAASAFGAVTFGRRRFAPERANLWTAPAK